MLFSQTCQKIALVATRPAVSASVSKTSVRCFAAAASKDVIKDLYLNAVRSYKPPNVAVDTSDIKELKIPARPSAPAIEKDFSADLAAYDVPETSTSSASNASLSKDSALSDYPLRVLYAEEMKEWAEDEAAHGPLKDGDALLGFTQMKPESYPYEV